MPQRIQGSSLAKFRKGQTIYNQGDTADAVYQLLSGRVMLSMVSPQGKEAVVELIGTETYFGEECLAGQSGRACTAMALDACSLTKFDKQDIRSLLRKSPEFSEQFMRAVLRRTNQVRENLADQLLSCSERRLARTLLNLAKEGTIPRMSQTTLAAMVGTTRSRISYFMGKFRKMGLIEYGRGIRVNEALITAMLRQ